MRCYFENIEKEIINSISQATETLEIAVTWVDFCIFQDTIIQLLSML